MSNTTGTGSIISTVRSFKWSPNSRLIAFNVVVRGSGLSELLVADPSVLFPTPVPLSGTLQSLGEVMGFEWSPDSVRVAYRADQFVDNRFDLLTVLANGSRPPDLISRLTNDSSEVRDFAWAPDSSRIAYIADQDAVGVFELYTDNDRRNLQPAGFRGTQRRGKRQRIFMGAGQSTHCLPGEPRQYQH